MKRESRTVSPEYFSSLGIPILQGRGFTSEEGTSRASVVIVSNATVQRLWPNQNAVGQTLYIHAGGATEGRKSQLRVNS